MLLVRPPAVAGRFYNIDPERLKKQISVCFDRAEKDNLTERRGGRARELKIAVVPHAGYEYSGWVAAKIYSMLDDNSPKNFIILGPNHYMFGSNFATVDRGLWKTPLGGVTVHEQMSESLLKTCNILENDFMPHQNEHSIEVQLPFLQYALGPDIKIVPMSITNETADDSLLNACTMIGNAIADVIKKSEEEWIVLAASDFSHYVPQKFAEEVDNYLIKSIIKLNEKMLFRRVDERNAGMCGYGAVAAAIVAAKKMGSKSGKLLKYGTTADTTGDANSVVGYASILL